MWLITHNSTALLKFHDYIFNLNVILMWRGGGTHTHICFIPDQSFFRHLRMSYNAEHICNAGELCYFSMWFRLFVYFIINSQ